MHIKLLQVVTAVFMFMTACSNSHNTDVPNIVDVTYQEASGSVPPDVAWHELYTASPAGLAFERTGASTATTINTGSWIVNSYGTNEAKLFSDLSTSDVYGVAKTGQESVPAGGGIKDYTIRYDNGEIRKVFIGDGSIYSNASLFTAPINSYISKAALPAGASNRYRTPMSNAETEQLSIEATGALIAPQTVYDRVDTELNSIRASYPPTVNITAMPSWSLQSLIIGFDAAGWNAVKAGTYRAWDVLNRTYGVTAIDTNFIGGFALLTFAGRYNAPLLADEYAKLPDVLFAESDNIFGDGNDVCLSIDGENHYFIFDSGSGDCPSGCIQHSYWGYEVAADGGITELGTWDSSSGNARPAWLVDLPACRAWL
jgi:hypothetical protein